MTSNIVIKNDVGMVSFGDVLNEYRDQILKDFNIENVDQKEVVKLMVENDWISIELHKDNNMLGHMMAQVEGDNIDVHIFIKPEFRHRPDRTIRESLKQINSVFGNSQFTTQVDISKHNIQKTLESVGFREVEADDELVYFLMDGKNE